MSATLVKKQSTLSTQNLSATTSRLALLAEEAVRLHGTDGLKVASFIRRELERLTAREKHDLDAAMATISQLNDVKSGSH